MEDSDMLYRGHAQRDERSPHRTAVERRGAAGAPRPVQTVYAQPSRVYYQKQPQVVYATTPASDGARGERCFGKVTPGQLVDLVAQIFAALIPLPGAPVATDSAATDVGNLILYQSALASYAKRDEQVRTLGNLVTKLIG